MFADILRVVRDFTENLIEKHKGMMMQLACSITDNYQDAEDAVQEALLILSGKQQILKDLDSDDAKNYIYTVTKNRSINLCKKAKKCVTLSEENAFTHIEGEPDVRAFVNELGFSSDTALVLETLPPEDRDLICYYYGFGYSYEEISKLMGIPPVTLRKRMQRCRKRLTQILER